MMGIWYSCDNRNKKYLKFILFNKGTAKIVSNYQIKRELQTKFIFKDGSKFLELHLNDIFDYLDSFYGEIEDIITDPEFSDFNKLWNIEEVLKEFKEEMRRQK